MIFDSLMEEILETDIKNIARTSLIKENENSREMQAQKVLEGLLD